MRAWLAAWHQMLRECAESVRQMLAPAERLQSGLELHDTILELREGFLFVPQNSAELFGVVFRPGRFQRRVSPGPSASRKSSSR